jgi:hypothetical protein
VIVTAAAPPSPSPSLATIFRDLKAPGHGVYPLIIERIDLDLPVVKRPRVVSMKVFPALSPVLGTVNAWSRHTQVVGEILIRLDVGDEDSGIFAMDRDIDLSRVAGG